MERDKVSIVIPVYKGEHTVERCIDSIENGSYKNIEIIAVNDCSPDNTKSVLHRLEKKYDNLIVLENLANKGVSYTRNHGLSKITGKYLMFVDCDDWVSPDYVKDFTDAIFTFGLPFVISGYINHDEKFNNKTDFFGYFQEDTFSKYDLSVDLPQLYKTRLLQQLWNKIFLADVVRDNMIRFDESISMGEDFRFILKYLQLSNVKEFIFINKGLYHYIRDNGNSLMSTFGNADIREQLKNIRMMLPLLCMSDTEKRAFYEHEKNITKNHYAYRIIHTENLSMSQKIQKIKYVSEKKWGKLFMNQLFLLLKEKIATKLIKKKRIIYDEKSE